MLWKVDGVVQKTPSTYKDNIEDTDNPIAVGMLKLEMTWDCLKEEEAEHLLQLTYRNPLIATVKCPSVQGGMLENAKFRVSKRTSEMHLTGDDEDTSKSLWKVSFNLMQKELTEQQKQTVINAGG